MANRWGASSFFYEKRKGKRSTRRLVFPLNLLVTVGADAVVAFDDAVAVWARFSGAC